MDMDGYRCDRDREEEEDEPQTENSTRLTKKCLISGCWNKTEKLFRHLRNCFHTLIPPSSPPKKPACRHTCTCTYTRIHENPYDPCSSGGGLRLAWCETRQAWCRGGMVWHKILSTRSTAAAAPFYQSLYYCIQTHIQQRRALHVQCVS